MIAETSMKNITTDTYFDGIDDNSEREKYLYKINATVNHNIVGYMKIEKTIYKDDFRCTIEITYIKTLEGYVRMGVAKALYKEFGRLFEEKFRGFQFINTFVNPIAEYVFRDSIVKGYIPQEALQEDYIWRFYTKESEQKLFDFLMTKIPLEYRPNRTSYIF